jgi:predicted nucleic acid-binding protein
VYEQALSLAWEQKLRGADAIHLAAARQIGNQASRRSLEFVLVSADNELLRAAKSFELAVTNPAVIT